MSEGFKVSAGGVEVSVSTARDEQGREEVKLSPEQWLKIVQAVFQALMSILGGGLTAGAQDRQPGQGDQGEGEQDGGDQGEGEQGAELRRQMQQAGRHRAGHVVQPAQPQQPGRGR